MIKFIYIILSCFSIGFFTHALATSTTGLAPIGLLVSIVALIDIMRLKDDES